jgi:hypothetical protein
MGGMGWPVAKAYVAPIGPDETSHYSVLIDQPDGGYELSPHFDSLADGIAWALERTDFVVARENLGGYFWYGRGTMPPDITAPPD